MFNNLRKFLQGEVSHFYLLSLAVVLATSAINIARADVCFLPDSEGCEMVPYEEYGGTPNYPKNCFATKAEAMSARTASLDSYYQNGNMWCIKQSCSASLYNSNYKGGNWSCDQCPEANSIRANFYNCTCPLTAKLGYEINYNICAYAISQCTGSATTSCVTNECQTCAETGQYSGGKECKIPTPVKAHCPKGYVPDKPSSKCYSTQDMLCGEGKCYNAATTIPDCSGEGKQLSDDNGACWCSCKKGYHDDNGSCVLNKCASGVDENTCGTGYTFNPNNTSFINTSGNTIQCGNCVLNQCTSGVEESACNTSTHNFSQTGSYVNVSGQTIKCGSCVSVCNINDNQYPDSRSCEQEWHVYWTCMKNETTGCYYPICDYSMNYYENESDCWHYGTQEEGTCKLAEATKNSEIPCYEIWSSYECDPGDGASYTRQECEYYWHPEDGCFQDSSTGCWFPYRQCGPNAYANKSDCEYWEIDSHGYGYCKQDDTGCWVGYHDGYYDPSRGYIRIACDNEIQDYGQDYDNFGCPGYAEMFDENNKRVAQVRFSLGDNSPSFYQLPTGRYTVKFHPGVRFTAVSDFAKVPSLNNAAWYGFVNSFKFIEDDYNMHWRCGFGPEHFHEDESLRSVTCEERCFCNDYWGVLDCFNDYSITFDYMSEQDTIVVDFMPKSTNLRHATREPPDYFSEVSRNYLALNDGSHQCTYTITTGQWTPSVGYVGP